MLTVLICSTAALVTGFVLDQLFGDPRSIPHLVRWMGGLISVLERALRSLLPRNARGEVAGGVVLVLLTVLVCTGIPLAALAVCYALAPAAGFVLESLLCWQLLAATSLKRESATVQASLEEGNIAVARQQVSQIVGRDTAELDGEGITRATVETVAENTADGVVAPLFFIMLGGAPAGCLYKAVNTMDSMVGYKNERYLFFGRAAAKTDDVLNYLPARLSALLMVAAALLLKRNAREALRIWRRDRRKHASPNSAQTEAACAGALGIQLAGPAVYGGKELQKPFIGDAVRPIVPTDIKAAGALMMVTAYGMLALALLFRLLYLGGLWYASL